jgi:hypothetical protein
MDRRDSAKVEISSLSQNGIQQSTLLRRDQLWKDATKPEQKLDASRQNKHKEV